MPLSKQSEKDGGFTHSNNVKTSTTQGPTKNVDSHAATARKLRGKRGGLQNMPQMPIDVLGEIFGFMQPRDLLNLARTSKPFRSCLISRSSAYFWKAARSNIPGLPDCPPHLSEPAYANYAFTSHCHHCLKPAVHNSRRYAVFWVRYCIDCADKMFVHEEVFEDFITRIRETTNSHPPFNKYINGFEHTYHRPDVERYRVQWDALGEDVEARKQLVTEIKASEERTYELGCKFSTWTYDQNHERSLEKNAMKSRRMDAIVARLREEGWSEEIDRMGSPEFPWGLGAQRFAKQTSVLTDRIWHNIRREAVAWIEYVRDDRLVRAHERPRFKAFNKFVRKWAKKHWPEPEEPDALHVPFTALMPLDFYHMADVQKLLDLPASEQVSEEVITKALQPDHMAKLVSEWIQARRKELVARLRLVTMVDLPRKTDKDQDMLRLAIHSFDCSRCPEQFIPYPDVIGHRCRNLSTDKPVVSHQDPMTLAYVTLSSYALCWDITNVFVNVRVFPHKGRALIQACGFDPDTATREDMERCRKRMTCADCTEKGLSNGGGYEVFDWKRALVHQDIRKHCDSNVSCRWVILPEEIAFAVRAFELEVVTARPRLVGVYTCNMGCDPLGYGLWFDWETLVEHLRDRHKIKEKNLKDVELVHKHYGNRSTSTMRGIHIYHTENGDVKVGMEEA